MAILTEGLQNLEEPFGCSAATVGDLIVVTVHGELDLATRGRVEAVLLEAEATAGRGLVVDLRELLFLGSTGLSILIASAGRATARGISFEIVPSDGVRRLLAMTGVDRHLALREDAPAKH